MIYRMSVSAVCAAPTWPAGPLGCNADIRETFRFLRVAFSLGFLSWTVGRATNRNESADRTVVYFSTCEASTVARMFRRTVSGSVGQALTTRCRSGPQSMEVGLSAPDIAPPLRGSACNCLPDRLVTPVGPSPVSPISDPLFLQGVIFSPYIPKYISLWDT
jgi:hypothetical protein